MLEHHQLQVAVIDVLEVSELYPGIVIARALVVKAIASNDVA